jgi:hypothetical protein
MNTESGPELCPKCLNPNPAGVHLCEHCGAPLTSHAATDPALSIAAEGHVVRSAVANPHKPIILVGIWLVGLPAMGAGVVALYNALTSPSVEAVLRAGAGLGLLALWGAIAYKATRNYFRMRRAERSGQGAA